jgi:flagellum-specific ATP synthase
MMLMGAYAKGQDPALDEAVELWPRIEAFIGQDIHEPASLTDSITDLMTLTGGTA